MWLRVRTLLPLLLSTVALGSPASPLPAEGAAPDAGAPQASARMLRVRVLGPEGAPLPGSKVQLVPEPLEGVHLWLETDDKGESVHPAPAPGRYRVLAYWTAQGRFRRYVWQDVELRPGTDDSRVELRFERRSTPPISGQVRNLDGLPVAGATVEAYQHFPSVPLDEDFLRNTAWPRETTTATTDAEGRFTLEPLRAGDYGLEVRHEEGIGDATARTGGPPVDIMLAPRCARTASGRVVDERGAPVTRFQVDSHRVRDAKGRFTLEGACYLNIEAGGFVSQGFPLLGFKSKHVDMPDIVLERGRQLMGRVLDADGKPVADVQLTAHWTGITSRPDSASTNASGRFSLGPVPTGREVTLTAIWDEGAVRQRIAPGKEGKVTFRFPIENARLEVRILDSEGAPLQGMDVTAESTAGEFSLRTDGSGQAVRSVPAGAYEVRVTREPSLPPSKSHVPRRFAPVSVQLPEGGTAPVELRQQRGTGRLRVLLPRPSHYEGIHVVPGAHDWPADTQALGKHLESRLVADARADLEAQPAVPLIGYTSQNDFSELVPGPYTVFAMNPYDDGPRLLLFRKVVHIRGPERQVVQVRFEGEDTRRLP
ncbi:carboxypeptidase-like regulatory domain-containing protein [Myxococcus sp. RHSTA-1-4]|uniref:carboxypeptidase-like regulatory domain-containing protein n=1 Tax=Myxococcus sp. RHSTA-1-4 TaxID=2874601 RepID=UPI001CC16F1D|nr:carboxypeptidase-like regulatory domain-containing protein [Myxococcus sp. RHSTA-1-4]MBZ4415498.1 carboxypeptidase regulatory-like domain-containing protein [Myxococcus sp. RHSTA-1-4]